MKKTIIVLFIFLLIIPAVLFAGGKKEESAATGTEKSAASEEKITLNYVTWMSGGEDQATIDAFMKENPNIEVKVQIPEGSRYRELLLPRLVAGDIPDVMMIMHPMVSEFAAEGFIADVSGSSCMDFQKQVPSVHDALTIDGKTYGFALVAGTTYSYIWYNKKIFDSLGLSEPKTYDEYFEVCEKIKQSGIDPDVIGGRDKWPYKMHFWTNASLIGGRGMELTGSADPNEAFIRGAKPSDLYRESAEIFKEMVDREYFSKASPSITYPESVQYFVDGKSAMLSQGPWIPSVPEIGTGDPEKFELAVMVPPQKPVYDGKKYAFVYIERVVAMSAQSKHPEAAKKLFDFFTSRNQVEDYLSRNSSVTVLPYDYDMAPLIQKVSDGMEAQGFEYATMATPEVPGMEAELWHVYANINAGATVDEEMDRIDEWYELSSK